MKWVDIPEWGTRYSISEYGHVRSKDMVVGAKGGAIAIRKGRLLTQVLKNSGYFAITLTNGVDRPQVAIHRLVARAFIGECPLGLHVLHSDGDKANNHYSNLRYGTPAENVADTAKHGKQRMGVKHPMAKLNVDAVRHIRASEQTGVFMAALYHVTAAHISAIRRNKVWQRK